MMCYVIDMFKWRGVVASALFTVVAVTGAVAHAADYMWMSSPADALWNTTSLNWNSGEAWVDGNNAIFGSSSQTAVNIDGSRTATAITVSSGDYTFSGTDTLTLNGEFIVGSGLAATVTAPFASTGDDSSRRFIKTGDGSLTFKNTTASVLRYRHHSGTVTLDNSTLTVTKTGLAGTSDSASAFVMNGGDIILTNNATCKIASGGRVFTTTGDIRIYDGATLDLTGCSEYLNGLLDVNLGARDHCRLIVEDGGKIKAKRIRVSKNTSDAQRDDFAVRINEGGIIELVDFYMESYCKSSMYFNGGTIYSTGEFNAGVWGNSVAYVEAGGLHLVQTDANATIRPQLLSRVAAGETDGGVHLSGGGVVLYIMGENAYNGGTYIDSDNNLTVSLSSEVGDSALGKVPEEPATNIWILGKSQRLFCPGNNAVVHSNRTMFVKNGALLGVGTQSSLTFCGEIKGEAVDGLDFPTNTTFKVLNNWNGTVAIGPGEGRTNDLGRLSIDGRLVVTSGVTRIANAHTINTNSGIGDYATAYVSGNGSAYNDYKGHLVVSGGELYAPQVNRRFHVDRYGHVEVKDGGKINIPNLEYLNGINSPATLTLTNGGELVCREFRLSQSSGAGGVVNLNKGGKLTVAVFRMDAADRATLNMNGGAISRRTQNFGESVFMGGHKDNNMALYANVTCNVLEGGAVFDPEKGYNIFWNLPFKSGVAEGAKDGGLFVRDSGAVFVLTVTGSDYNGPTRLGAGARVQCRAANALPTGTTLQMGAGSNIGFNTWTDTRPDLEQIVARAEGCGRIYNNSLFHVTEAIAPVFDGAYGTLTFEKVCDLNGDYEISGDANGCSCVKFERAGQDISHLKLKVASFASIDKSKKYKILDAPNGYGNGSGGSNRFDTSALPGTYAVKYTDTAAYLYFVRGTSFTIR